MLPDPGIINSSLEDYSGTISAGSLLEISRALCLLILLLFVASLVRLLRVHECNENSGCSCIIVVSGLREIIGCAGKPLSKCEIVRYPSDHRCSESTMHAPLDEILDMLESKRDETQF